MTDNAGNGVGKIMDEVGKLIKQAMEMIGEDRILFSHVLLGPL